MADLKTKEIIFKIALEDRSPVYMRAEQGEYIVIVDAQAFLKLWRVCPSAYHQEISHGNRESWENDYKFHYAEDGFNAGLDSPVPLAEVSCYDCEIILPFYKRIFLPKQRQSKLVPCVNFINGITRTIWLLSHGAKSFPVKCWQEKEALQLARAAGYPAYQYLNIL